VTSPPVSAAIDIGSNSVHLLVAKPGPGSVPVTLVDASEQTGIGRVVDERGAMGARAREGLATLVAGYVGQARELGAAPVLLLGTEPCRRASDAAALAGLLLERAGLPIAILDRTQEGLLTFVGVTGGRLADRVAVVDIGGGSTEVTIGGPGVPTVVEVLPAGSARLAADLVHHDPVSAEEVAALQRAARAHVEPLGSMQPARAIVSGGSGTNVSRLLGRARATPIDRAAIEEALALLQAHPAEELARRTGLTPRRVAQLAAGLAIGEALMDHLGLAVAEVSDASLREGALMAAWAAGPDWLAALPELAAGTRSGGIAGPAPDEPGGHRPGSSSLGPHQDVTARGGLP
jgi:exopolyphosphatase/guanosine-5'-triphosphate,3'-diphosphate pyrophosphatase